MYKGAKHSELKKKMKPIWIQAWKLMVLVEKEELIDRVLHRAFTYNLSFDPHNIPKLLFPVYRTQICQASHSESQKYSVELPTSKLVLFQC